ncbi:hypothetical protein F5146DRAFT_1053067 [Armillaria mellea]|nr:hypothetical protein F5146DRAFT_1053067 [Armillaria mellea]
MSSCRIFTIPLTPVGQLALLKILSFHNGIPSSEAASPSGKIFHTNAIRCLLSPCPLDNYPQLRRQYGELEWDLLENVVIPFISQSSTLRPKVAAEQCDLTCLPTGSPSLHDGGVLIRVFEEVGGILSLYTRFKDAPLPDRQKELPAYLAGHITDMMIAIDTFDPLHISSLGPSTFSCVENLLFLTRLLLYKLDWERIGYLLEKLITRKDISESMWEDYIKHLHRWISDEEFEVGWEEERRANVTPNYITDIHDLLPIKTASPECTNED